MFWQRTMILLIYLCNLMQCVGKIVGDIITVNNYNLKRQYKIYIYRACKDINLKVYILAGNYHFIFVSDHRAY